MRALISPHCFQSSCDDTVNATVLVAARGFAEAIATWLHPDRNFGRHRHRCSFGGDSVSRLCQSARKRAARIVPVELEANRNRTDAVHAGFRWALSAFV